jgi:acetyl-CoA acetyltransferase family protein
MPADWTIPLGETAERVARKYQITRQEQDAFALQSQHRAEAAVRAGVFERELVPIQISGAAERVTICQDETPRSGLTLEQLGRLPPAFTSGGSVTAATSSGISDGAAALAIASGDILQRLELEPMARVVATAVAGIDPSCMGLGPIPATRKALQRAGLTISQIDLIELNEAFAAQAIACIRELELDPNRVNLYGGAIALGHPLGASGAKILTTLVHALQRTGGRYGLATMCIGVGQGIALIVESSA